MILYHFTALEHLDRIMATGLTKGEMPLWLAHLDGAMLLSPTLVTPFGHGRAGPEWPDKSRDMRRFLLPLIAALTATPAMAEPAPNPFNVVHEASQCAAYYVAMECTRGDPQVTEKIRERGSATYIILHIASGLTGTSEDQANSMVDAQVKAIYEESMMGQCYLLGVAMAEHNDRCEAFIERMGEVMLDPQ